MSDFLDLKCPPCGDDDHVDIAATPWVMAREDGADAAASGDGEYEIESESPAPRVARGHRATVADFDPSAAAAETAGRKGSAP